MCVKKSENVSINDVCYDGDPKRPKKATKPDQTPGVGGRNLDNSGATNDDDCVKNVLSCELCVGRLRVCVLLWRPDSTIITWAKCIVTEVTGVCVCRRTRGEAQDHCTSTSRLRSRMYFPSLYRCVGSYALS